MAIDAARLLARAHRSPLELTRRDVARLMLSMPSKDALAAMPTLRHELLAAGNPLSAGFWQSAESILRRISEGAATVGGVHGWLEATGTEPTAIMGLYVWDEESARTPLGREMHELLVEHLEGCLSAGEIDPERLLADDPAATQEYRALQERWMISPLPDGRVPMHELLDEEDEDDDFLAELAAGEQAAADDLRDVLAEVGQRPQPDSELRAACRSLRTALRTGARSVGVLRASSGVDPDSLDADDRRLWLRLAAGVVNPVYEPSDGTATDEIPGIALDYEDWLAAVSALARGGPATPASAMNLARFIQDADDEDDIRVLAGWLRPVVEQWRVLGAVDEHDRLTPLGWWGIPEALLQAWPGDTVV
ncbi:MAG: hypothetical protein LC749_12935 [Actinobacteria bacterium]|nr:hypothetical protein [Actinomycetota bacterium]